MKRSTSTLYVFSLLALGNAFVTPPPFSESCRSGPVASAVAMAMSSTSAAQGAASNLKSILKKPSKVLTVGVGCDFGSALDASEISILSMQLRKSKVSAIWCSNLEAIKEFTSEQETAKGSFPGPLPIIYSGSVDGSSTALQNGASAVVLSASDDMSSVGDAEVVWSAGSLDEVTTILEATSDAANVFLVNVSSGEEFDAIVQAVPKASLCIASVEPMQADGAEIDIGKNLKKVGCGSVLVPSAIVGDAEDLPYAQFLVDGFTSKASSEFKFSGLTGSTNGHFGGVQASGSDKWLRAK